MTNPECPQFPSVIERRETMLKRTVVFSLLLALLAGPAWSAKTKDKTPIADRPKEQKQPLQSPSTDLMDKIPESVVTHPAVSPDAFAIPWQSVNAGGVITMTSTNFGMKASVGQWVIGYSTSTNYQMGIGF